MTNITPALIAELREMASKATPLPWRRGTEDEWQDDAIVAKLGEREFIIMRYNSNFDGDSDLEYAVAATNHLPALLDGYERLLQLDEPMPCGHAQRHAVGSDTRHCALCEVEARIDELEAANSRLLAAAAGRGMVSELDNMRQAAVLVCGLYDRIAELEDQIKIILSP